MRLILSLCMTAVCSNFALAETFYLDEMLNAKLSTADTVLLRRECTTRIIRGIVHRFPGNRNMDIVPYEEPDRSVVDCAEIAGKLTVKGAVEVIDSTIVLDTAVRSNLPDQYRLDSAFIRNCTSSDVNYADSGSIQSSINQSITNSTQISKSRVDSLTAGISIKVEAVTGQFSGSRQWSSSIQSNESKTQSESENITKNYSISQPIKSNTIVEVTKNWIGSEIQIPWMATFVVDGAVTDNLSGKSRVSDVLTLAERTVSTSGILSGFRLTDHAISFSDTKLSDEYCNQIPSDQKYQVFNGIQSGTIK